MNVVVLKGNLTRDPEIRATGGGTAVASIAIAVNKRFKDSSGERQERTDFFNITAWGQQAEACGQYLHKGSSILVKGALRQNKWETEDGQKRSSVEVVAESIEFLNRKGSGDQDGDAPEDSEEKIPF